MHPMTPCDFITTWRASARKECSAAQEHFIDLCRLLGEPTSAEADQLLIIIGRSSDGPVI